MVKFITDTMKAVQAANIPTVLVVAGIIFILLALAGGFTGKIEIPKRRQKWSGIVGAVLLVVGLCLFAVPVQSPSVADPNSLPPISMPPSEGPTGDVPSPTTSGSNEPLPGRIAKLQEIGLDALVKRNMVEADRALQEAENLLNGALDETPNDVTLLNLKGYLHKNWALTYQRLDMGNKANHYIDYAEKTFHLILTINDRDPGAWNGLGSVFIFRRDLDRAEEYVRKALEIAPNYQAAKSDLQLIQRLKRANSPE